MLWRWKSRPIGRPQIPNKSPSTHSDQAKVNIIGARESQAQGSRGLSEVAAKPQRLAFTSITLKDTGHWLMEQRPAETKAARKEFFAN
jgi:hypothetical protein